MTIGDDGIASICIGKEHNGSPCPRCGHTNPRESDGSCSARGYNGVDCQPQPCFCRNHIAGEQVKGEPSKSV